MASGVDVVDATEIADHLVVHESLMIIQLEVADPEVIGELQKHLEGAPRDRYASGALRLGVLALRQASGELDCNAIRQAGQDILHQVEQLLTEHGTKITGDIGSALRQYFDPTTGALPQRIESLLKQDGDLERALRQHIGPGNSTIGKASKNTWRRF